MLRTLLFINLILYTSITHPVVGETNPEKRPSGNLPDSLTYEVFSALIREMSEPDGEFHSNNFTSNESSYLHAIDILHGLKISGGVYIGVGPEQNLTYIAEIKPDMAFIVDIRRQNMLLHLVYKALFELSDTRVSFLSRLLSKPLVDELPFFERMFNTEPTWAHANTQPSLEEMIKYFDSVTSERALYEQNLLKVKALVKTYGISSPDDLEVVEFIFHTFFKRQLDVKYDLITPVSETTRSYPTLRDLLLSVTIEGEMAGFLAEEDSFTYLKEMHNRNLIVPVVGSFSGNNALRSIAQYTKSNHALISAFYTSNVEMYLSLSYPLDVDWENRDGYDYLRFVDNVTLLPIDESSVFIRAYHNDHFHEMMSHPNRINDHVFTTIVQPISHLLHDESWRLLRGYDRYIRIVTNGVLE